MFHPNKIAAAIEDVYRRHGLRLIEHSIAECAKVYDHFQSITVPDGKKRVFCRNNESPDQFQLVPWESEWIRNEMYMCACSFPYWFFRYFFLKSKEGQIKRPDPLPATLIVLDILAEFDRENLPVLILFLKARQLGISTVIEAAILWISIFRRGSHCVIASAEEEKSEEMSNMVWIGLENLPLWMYPTLTRDDRAKGPEFGLIDSDILIQHGAMTKGISRGSTPVAAHLSEVAYYPNPIETIESSLIRAMHENPRTFLVLESTARKKGDWWHRTWEKNREGEDSGYNRFACMFLPWYVGTDKYPTADFLRSHPIPAEWHPMPETIKQAVDAKFYVATTPLLRKYLGADWSMPRHQQWFWEFNYVEAKREDDTLKAFMAEMAADERSCFQSKKFSVYSVEVLNRVDAQVKKAEEKYQDYALIGDGVESKFHLRDYWSAKSRRIDIIWPTNTGVVKNWKLVPLRETPTSPDMDYYIRIWEHPKPGYNYTIGVDIGGGVGADNTSFDILRTNPRDKESPDVQVAQLYTPWICSPAAPPFAAALGIYFGKHMPQLEALMCPEVQVATGDPISYELDKLGYVNFYYMKRFDLRRHPGTQPTRRGWASVSWSRQMMLEREKQGIDAGWIVINSDKTAREMSNLEADETDSGKTRYDHASGENNDSIFSLGIAYICSHDEDTIMDRLQGKVRPRKSDEEEKERRKNEWADMDSTEVMLARHFVKEDEQGMEELGVVEGEYGLEGDGVY